MESLRVSAASEKEALVKAKEELETRTGNKLAIDDLTVELLEENRGFLGFGRKKVYQVTVKNKGISQGEAELLEQAIEEISIDGYFAIKIDDQGVFLRVLPPEGDGQPVDYQEIRKALENKEIIDVDWREVQSVIRDAADEWIKIAPRRPELDKDGRAEVEISRDKLKAFLSYYPDLGGRKLTTENVLKELENAGVIYGIKEEIIGQLIENRKHVEHLLIAEGDSPVPGKDARLIYHFEQKTESIGTEREDGSIDFFNLGLITNVQPGDILVTKKNAETGKPGTGVTGEEIPPPEPRDKNLPSGKNVLKKDENTLIAEMAGQIVIDENRIHILPVYEVSGDVDLTTGNIDFIGNVVIRGDVKEGFNIKAQGNIEIKGNVTGANIQALGKVIIYKGFIGKGKTQITAGGDVMVKFVENGIISTRKNITVIDAIMHSQLTAGESIEVVRKKGLLVGGIYRAGNRITANIIGSILGTATYLEVGIDPELRKQIGDLEEDVKKARISLHKSEKAINILNKVKEKEGHLPQEKELLFKRLIITAKRLEKMINQKETEIATLHEEIRFMEGGYIAVNKRIFSGVRLTVGSFQYNVQDEMGPTKFIEYEGKVEKIAL